jgi:exodeoxyribonuclease VII large subunit
MPELINNRQILSLLEVTTSIQKTISERYRGSYWIKAELNKLNYYKQSGHCYPELVEKKEGKIVAQIRSNLWKDDYIKIDGNFKKVLNETLKDGIKILFLASINFHPEYGLNLRIIDIDPSYTLGDLEKEKQETIKRLKDEDIYSKNKNLRLPTLPQRIAIISVDTSKGYADFLQVFEQAKKSWKYNFFHVLFPSLLQGDNAVPAIIKQLNKIRQVINHFDVVAIIRGGGGDIGLSCYNNYTLAKEIALFPIPVITGIGHATNETVVEMISFQNAITPTKLAEFLIQKFHNYSVPIKNAEEKIIERSKRLITDEKNKFASEMKLFKSVTNNMLLINKNLLNENKKLFIYQSNFIFKNHNTELENIEKNINNMNPENVLKRGYSITYLNGKAISSIDNLTKGDILQTVLNEGKITSTVDSTNKY